MNVYSQQGKKDAWIVEHGCESSGHLAFLLLLSLRGEEEEEEGQESGISERIFYIRKGKNYASKNNNNKNAQKGISIINYKRINGN